MGLTHHTPEYWRARAEEVRAVSGSMHDAAQRRILVEIAQGYDRLAQRAEDRQRRDAED
jgi:hypothetical protein